MKLKYFILAFLLTVLIFAPGCAKKTTSESIADILSKSKDIDSISYEMVSDINGMKMNQKFYQKNNNTRTEINQAGQNMIYIMNSKDQTGYTYFPDQNMAMEIDYSEFEDTSQESALDLSDSIIEYNPVILGNETIDGKRATIIEYNIDSIKSKMWIWEKHGLALKMETTTPEGVITVEFKNYDFSNIPDSMFELPNDVQSMDLNNLNIPNLPDFSEFNL